MLHKILCHHSQSLRIAQNLVHLCNSLLTLLYLILVGTLLLTFLVVVLNLLQLFAISKHLGSTTLVNNPTSNTISH